jgi:16S rRNA U516 pseudouridylate synthase RsuA-like enzyme
VQGLGLRDGQIHVIAENKEVLVFDTHSSRLAAVGADNARNTTDSPRAPLPRYLDYHNAAVFIIHKPVGCVSSAVDYETCPRGTVYEHAGKAGYPTNMGLVGRLDGDTSGIMVFTNDGLLHDRIIRPPQELRGVALPARLLSGYDQLLLSGAKTVLDLYKTKEYILSVLQGRNSYCLSAEGEFDVARFEEEFGKPLVFNRCNSEYSVKEAQIKVLRRHQVPEHNKHGRADMGWVIDVLVTIREGKHKQIRRLAKRAGYHVVGLQRTMICGGMLRLDSIEAPGSCRWLAAEEKRELYEAFNLLS